MFTWSATFYCSISSFVILLICFSLFQFGNMPSLHSQNPIKNMVIMVLYFSRIKWKFKRVSKNNLWYTYNNLAQVCFMNFIPYVSCSTATLQIRIFPHSYLRVSNMFFSSDTVPLLTYSRYCFGNFWCWPIWWCCKKGFLLITLQCRSLWDTPLR